MNEFISVFKQVQTELGEMYLSIGDNFNGLMQELETSLASCLTIVKNFKSQADSDDESSLRNRVYVMESLVEKESDNYSELSGASDTVLNRVTESFNNLRNINVPVAEIQDAADLMSLLALNSMVVAIQAGSKGGGFTCITEELKQTSTATYQTSVEIQREAGKVASSYNDFITLTDRIRNCEESIRNLLTRELKKEFSVFYTQLTGFVSFMESLETRSMQVKPSLIKLMQSIQNQDIIRQSMDHIILSLQELEKKHDLDGDVEVEELLLRKQIYSLTHVVLQDVKRWLETDLSSLEDSIHSCESLLKELNESKKQFIARQRDTAEGAEGLARQVVIIHDLVEKVLGENDISLKLRKEIWQENQKLLESVEGLELRSRGFQTITGLFRNINVMARIEIARTDVFGNIENAVSDMEGINERIESSVNRIFQINHSVREKNQGNDQDFRDIMEKNQNFQSVFENDIAALLSLLSDSIGMLDGALCDFDVLSSDFIRIFNVSKQKVEGIRHGFGQLKEMDQSIVTRIEEMDAELSRLDHDGVPVEENRKRIEKILNQFTIYRHKQEAGKLAGLNIQDDGNAEESSVVLF